MMKGVTQPATACLDHPWRRAVMNAAGGRGAIDRRCLGDGYRISRAINLYLGTALLAKPGICPNFG